jgi:hypothetical protein
MAEGTAATEVRRSDRIATDDSCRGNKLLPLLVVAEMDEALWQ